MQRFEQVLSIAVAIVLALALTGCMAKQGPVTPAPPASGAASTQLDAAATTSPEAVINRFLVALNAGDGDTMNALYGPEMVLYRNYEPAGDAVSDWSIAPAVDIDGQLGAVDASGSSESISDEQPKRSIKVSVRLNVAGDSGYFSFQQGPAKFDFTLFTMDGKTWRIHSIRMSQ